MTSLIVSYEQQYSNLTADITVNIGKIGNTLGGSTFHINYNLPPLKGVGGGGVMMFLGPCPVTCLWYQIRLWIVSV